MGDSTFFQAIDPAHLFIACSSVKHISYSYKQQPAGWEAGSEVSAGD